MKIDLIRRKECNVIIDFHGKQCVIMLEIYSHFQCQSHLVTEIPLISLNYLQKTSF